MAGIYDLTYELYNRQLNHPFSHALEVMLYIYITIIIIIFLSINAFLVGHGRVDLI